MRLPVNLEDVEQLLVAGEWTELRYGTLAVPLDASEDPLYGWLTFEVSTNFIGQKTWVRVEAVQAMRMRPKYDP